MNWTLTDESMNKALISAIVVCLLWLMRMIVVRLINRRINNMRVRYLSAQAVSYTVVLLSMLVLIRLWFEWVQSLITLLSVIAAALTIVNKELLLNFFAYSVIVWRGLFDVGDRIEVDKVTGDVIEIGPFYIALAEIGGVSNSYQTTGRVIKLPNSMVLTDPVINHTRGLDVIWNEVNLELPLSSNWRRAREIGLNIVRDIAYQPTRSDLRALREANADIMFRNTAPNAWVKPAKDHLLLTLRYPCKADDRAATELEIYAAILEGFAAEPEVDYPIKREATKDAAKDAAKAPAKASAKAAQKAGSSPA